MVDYIANVEDLIDFHPEVTTNLINVPPTLQVDSLMNRLNQAKTNILQANELELHRMELIRQRFGTLDNWLDYQEEQRKLREM